MNRFWCGWRGRVEKAGRERADICLRLLGQLALGMQRQVRGRVRQIGKRAAAELIAPELRNTIEVDRLGRAEEFIEQEETDSGIIVSRSAMVEFLAPHVSRAPGGARHCGAA
jgi:hypothetical protein